ncbi:MAG: hypothetical protein ACO1OG_11955 [Devosia sp.]
MLKLLRLAVLAATSVVLASPALAQDLQLDRIGTMSINELTAFTDTVIGTVTKDAAQLQRQAQGGDCAALTRSFNSLSLGYQMLGDASVVADSKPPRDALPLRVKLVQGRVVAFASWVRAEEWYKRTCRDYVTPAAQADDTRYAKPVPIGLTNYTEAALEVLDAAEANLAIVMAAGASKRCPELQTAMQSVQLFVPYMEKMAADISARPQALGPRANRRTLEAARGQLITAANRVYAQVGPSCAPPSEQAPPAEAPAQPETEAAPQP